MTGPVRSFTHPPAPTGTQFPTPSGAIISPQYCSPDPVDLRTVKKMLTISNGNFVVTDINNDDIIFKVRGTLLTLRDHHPD
ncbi:Protein LURP-one-related 15 [Morella rubra]|uniref:Protein LURP-one-related 15 n=1 Tax=Morella rubra TaxID=262757 RepID=A0A6A1WH95_9ROSI|nr:Protein LURP-one-related 15 [Morella rubra]